MLVTDRGVTAVVGGAFRHHLAHIRTHEHTHKNMHMCPRACSHAPTCVYARVHTHTETHVYSHSRTHTHAHARTHTRTRARARTHTHTHMISHPHTHKDSHVFLWVRCALAQERFLVELERRYCVNLRLQTGLGGAWSVVILSHHHRCYATPRLGFRVQTQTLHCALSSYASPCLGFKKDKCGAGSNEWILLFGPHWAMQL